MPVRCHANFFLCFFSHYCDLRPNLYYLVFYLLRRKPGLQCDIQGLALHCVTFISNSKLRIDYTLVFLCIAFLHLVVKLVQNLKICVFCKLNTTQCKGRALYYCELALITCSSWYHYVKSRSRGTLSVVFVSLGWYFSRTCCSLNWKAFTETRYIGNQCFHRVMSDIRENCGISLLLRYWAFLNSLLSGTMKTMLGYERQNSSVSSSAIYPIHSSFVCQDGSGFE